MDEQAPITFLIESADKSLADDAREAFAAEEVSISSNLIGGVEIAVFFLAAMKPVKDILKLILDFQATRGARYQTSRVTIGADSIELSGYGPDDIASLLELPMFQRREVPPAAP